MCDNIVYILLYSIHRSMPLYCLYVDKVRHTYISNFINRAWFCLIYLMSKKHKIVSVVLLREWRRLTCLRQRVTSSAAYWCLTSVQHQTGRSLRNAPGGVAVEGEGLPTARHGPHSAGMNCGVRSVKMLKKHTDLKKD